MQKKRLYSYRRPPEGLVKALDRVESPTSKAPVAKRKVESMRDKGAKRTADRKLHIDDGCMGGGKSVPFIEHFDWYPGHDDGMDELKWGGDVNKNGVIDGSEKGEVGHFHFNRWHIFHYCLLGNERIGQKWYEDKEGIAERGGDDFALWMDQIHTIKNEAQTFMHELGHNLDLGHCNDGHCAMETGLHLNDVTYCSDCWSKIDLNKVCDSSDADYYD